MKQYEIEVERTIVEKSKVWITAPNKRMAERYVRITSQDISYDEDPLTDEILEQVSVDEDGELFTHEKLKVSTIATYDLN